MFCLLHKYNANVDFGSAQLQEAVATDKRLTDFHMNLTSTLSGLSITQTAARWPAEDMDLYHWLGSKEAEIKQALHADFDTPTALALLMEVISRTYSRLGSGTPQTLVLESIKSLFSSVTSTLGLEYAANTSGGSQSDTLARTIIQEFVDFRKKVRTVALADGGVSKGDLLKLCDDVRNTTFPKHGIALKVWPSPPLSFFSPTTQAPKPCLFVGHQIRLNLGLR